MTAEEIRKSESGESSQGNEQAFWLREISAQLAELNENLRGKLSRERELLKRLIEWHDYLGGFDSQVWKDVQEFLNSKAV